MAKDKADYCATDDTLNITYRGSNNETWKERFRELSDMTWTLKFTDAMMRIGMEKHRNISRSTLQSLKNTRIPCTRSQRMWVDRYEEQKDRESLCMYPR